MAVKLVKVTMHIPADFRKLLRLASFAVVFFTMMTSGVAGEIHVAINEERFEDAIKLLEADARLAREKDHQQNKPLHLAALKGDTNLVSLLLAKGAEVNPRNKFGQTPLHRVMIGGSLATAKLLVEAKAEINGRDNQGVTPVHLAAQRRHGEIAQLLLDHGAEVDAHDGFRRRPLHMSIVGSCDVAMQALIKSGADYQYVDSAGNNYLHLAAGGGSPALVTILLELKLGVNSTNKSKITPGHFAAQSGHWETLEVLDKWGADFTLRSSNNRTPLDMVRDIRPPFRMERHDLVEAYLQKWHARQTNTAPQTLPPP